MAKKLSGAVGVDIGSQSIKIAEIKISGGQPIITAMAQAMTPEGAVDHIGIHDGEAVGNVVKQLCGASGVASKDMVISIAGQGAVLVRTLEVPNMSQAELDQHMEWEITRNVPFGEKTIQSDYKAFPAQESDAPNLDVVMAISPQSAIDMMSELAKKSGKKIAAIDVEPLGIARTLVSCYAEEYQGETICIIDIGHKTTAINIYKNGQLLMPRQVPVGGEMFTQQIAEVMNTSFDEAERIKVEQANIPAEAKIGEQTFAEPETQAFAPYNPFGDTTEEEPVATTPVVADTGTVSDPVFNAISSVLEELLAEARRSVDYFRSKGGDVDVILLCGGGSKLKGLPGFMEASLGVKTKLYDPTRGISQNIKSPSESVDEQHMEEFAVAVGNGLHICY